MDPVFSAASHGRPADATARVMLLCVWLDADAAWRARLVTADAQVHEFTSPFALAQFLSPLPLPRPLPASGGLR